MGLMVSCWRPRCYAQRTATFLDFLELGKEASSISFILGVFAIFIRFALWRISRPIPESLDQSQPKNKVLSQNRSTVCMRHFSVALKNSTSLYKVLFLASVNLSRRVPVSFQDSHSTASVSLCQLEQVCSYNPLHAFFSGSVSCVVIGFCLPLSRAVSVTFYCITASWLTMGQ